MLWQIIATHAYLSQQHIRNLDFKWENTIYNLNTKQIKIIDYGIFILKSDNKYKIEDRKVSPYLELSEIYIAGTPLYLSTETELN